MALESEWAHQGDPCQDSDRPWSPLEFSEDQGAYVVNFTKEQLQAAPGASIEDLARDDGMLFRDRSYAYYKEPRYWGVRRLIAVSR